MENYGCVTWSDVFVYRSAPTYTEREQRAVVLLHEMAHMWFGDIVTMRWWEDLWLNEAFAEWACYWAAEAATEFTDAWAELPRRRQALGYSADQGPTTHPIRQPVDDVAAGRRQLRRDHLSQGRQRAASSSSPSSARRRAWPACAATSPSTLGETPDWRT